MPDRKKQFIYYLVAEGYTPKEIKQILNLPVHKSLFIQSPFSNARIPSSLIKEIVTLYKYTHSPRITSAVLGVSEYTVKLWKNRLNVIPCDFPKLRIARYLYQKYNLSYNQISKLLNISYDALRIHLGKPQYTRTCFGCGKTFNTRSPYQLFCSNCKKQKIHIKFNNIRLTIQNKIKKAMLVDPQWAKDLLCKIQEEEGEEFTRIMLGHLYDKILQKS